MADHERDQYNEVAAIYDALEALPQAGLWREIVEYALEDCTGKTVLDLGGGTGLHARKAVDLGASTVDVVDISKGMMDFGESIEAKLGGNDKIRWFVGDMSEDLSGLPLDNQYDIVMVCWTFDHADTIPMLERMWENTAKHTKKGGKLVCIKMADPNCTSAKEGKYGVKFSDIHDIPDGVHYVYNALTTPPMIVPATTMARSLDFEQAKELAKQYGFVDYQRVPESKLEVVKNDPEFWQLHLDDPAWICVTATKG